MEFVPVNKCDIPECSRSNKGKSRRVLDEFVAGGYECVRIDEYGWKNVAVAAAEINKAIAKFGYAGVKAISRRGNLYLLRE